MLAKFVENWKKSKAAEILDCTVSFSERGAEEIEELRWTPEEKGNEIWDPQTENYRNDNEKEEKREKNDRVRNKNDKK